MKYFLSILTFIVCIHSGFAQYTELINSKRPGLTDSPFGVGTDVLQFEGGFFYQKIKDRGNTANSLGIDAMVRYSKFLEKLEVNLKTSFQHDVIDFEDQTIEDVSGFSLSSLVVGAKYLVYSPKYTDKSKEITSWKKRNSYDWKRLIPAVGVYAGANIPITKRYISSNIPKYHKDGFSPKIALYTQNNFTNKFIFIMNLIMDRIATNEKENSYIFTGTYSFNERWSAFAEHQGIFKGDGIPNDYQFGGGVAYLFSRNMQLDIAARTISDRGGSTLLINTGLSWRIDKHKDKFKLIGSDGKAAEPTKKEGNFFSRLFGKKNKAKKQRKVKKIKAKKRKIKKDKPRKKSKAQKRREKEKKRKEKEEQKKRKKELKDYNKNYDPKKDKNNDT